MTEQTGGDDLSTDIMNIFGISGDEGPAGATGGDGTLPNFGGELESGAAAVPPAQAAGAEGGAVSAPASPSAPPAPEPVAAPQPAAAPSGEPASPQPLPGLTPSPAPAAAQPGQEAPAAPAQATEAMELVSLRAQVQMLQQQLAQGTPQPGGQQPTPQAAPAGQGTGGQEEAPRYDLDIPDQVAQAIFHEDPVVAKKGMVHLVNQLATIIHSRARQEFRQELQQVRTGIQTERVQAEQAAEAERLKEEYFTAFPTHRDPVVQQIVAAENYALAREYPGHPFDDRYRAALGARVNQKLSGIAGLGGAPTPQVQPTAQPTTPVPPRPAAMLPSGRATGGQIPAFEQQADMVADVFSFND